MNNRIDFKRAINIISNSNKFKNKTIPEILSIIKKSEKRCTRIWNKSNYTDFSLYNSNDYLLQTAKTYKTLSEGSIKNLIKYLKENELNHKEFMFFDDYNGCGLTTLLLSINNYNVSYFNDNELQIHSLKKLYKWKNIKEPKRLEKRTGKFDVVISFEVIEHFKEPIKYLKEIIKMAKKYLIFTTGFSIPKPLYWYGHFPEYKINGNLVKYRTASRIINKEISKQFELKKSFWNGKPRIYKKIN